MTYLIKTNKYNIWVYSGDVDAAVPITGTLYWINKMRMLLGLSDIVLWRPWYITLPPNVT